tara:strand:- start:1042 stop:1992 length:951 start_codon:yes stop_codon:yes gene_type:complete
MKLRKPKFWDLEKPNLLSYLLLPFTILVIINNYFLNLKPKKNYDNIKSICLGNIYLGGTGKTPTAIKLYQIFKNLKIKVSIGKKYYKSHLDEQIILRNKCNLILEKNRKEVMEKAIKNNNEVIIFDDGLQDRNLDYDLKFVCFDCKNWIGNGSLIPSGPLREELRSLKKYDAVFLKDKNLNDDKIINSIKIHNQNIKIFYTYSKPLNLNKFDVNDKYLIFSGIGNPGSFKNILLNNNLKIIEEIIFPDHFNYKKEDIDRIKSKATEIGAKIITTEKDYVKISKINSSSINFLEYDLKINNENELIDFIKLKLYEKN